MSRAFRDGFLALGLVIGICGTIVVYVTLGWLNSISEPETKLVSQQVQLAPENYALEDLRAQISMAVSAEKMLGLTLISIFLGVVSAAAIFWTLMETRKGVRVSQEIGFSDRAWMTPSKYDLGVARNSRIDGVWHPIFYTVAQRWKNTGRSPALNLEIWADHRIVFQPGPIPSFDNAHLKMKFTVGPGDDTGSNGMPITPDQILLIEQWIIKWFVYSKATYNDIYTSETRVSECCYDVGVNGTMDDGSPVFTVRPAGPQNTST